MTQLNQKNITALYIENEVGIGEEFVNFFKNNDIPLLLASNPKEGWELFEQHYPEVVISDICIPILDDLELASKIKHHAPETQIIVMAAQSDTPFFIRSIEIGIDKFLLKPISIESLSSAFNDAAKKAYNHTMALEYEQYLLKDKINGAKHLIMENISDLYPFPTIVSSENGIFHVSKAFEKFLDSSTIARLREGGINLDTLLSKQKGALSSLSQYNENKPMENKIAIRTKNGHNKFFQIFIQKLEITENLSYQLTILNNITLENYTEEISQPLENNTIIVSNEKKLGDCDDVQESNHKVFDNGREIHDYLHTITDILSDWRMHSCIGQSSWKKVK